MTDQTLGLLDGDYTTYLSDDSVETEDDGERLNFIIEFFNSINPPGMLQHRLRCCYAAKELKNKEGSVQRKQISHQQHEEIPHHSQSSQHYQAQFSQPHQAQFSQPQQPYFTENIAPKQQFPSQPINLPTPLPVKHNFPTNRQVFGPPQPQNNVFHPKNSHKPTQKPEPMDTATRQIVRSNRFKPSGPRNFVAEELYNTEQTEPHPETFDYPDSYYDQSPYNANDIYSRTQTDFDLQKIEIPPQSIVAKDIRTSLPEGTELILDPLVYKDGAIEFSSCITKVKGQKATIEIRNNTGASQIFVLDKDFLQTFGTVIDPNEYECFSIENNSNHINSTCPTSLNFDQLRIDHPNFEEKSELYKLVKEFSSIFHTENEPLTFSNTVKHEIRTTDDIPIHTKSYRYPYVHNRKLPGKSVECSMMV
nr:unnamed protein product [Callosobruchus analis]